MVTLCQLWIDLEQKTSPSGSTAYFAGGLINLIFTSDPWWLTITSDPHSLFQPEGLAIFA